MKEEIPIEQYDYELPEELIAQTPLPRGDSRLMVIRRDKGTVNHHQFSDLPDLLATGDLLVMNDTRVSARRITGLRPNGLPVEVMLIARLDSQHYKALMKPAKSFLKGHVVTLQGPNSECCIAQITNLDETGARTLQFESVEVADKVEMWGQVPLPPYIHTQLPADNQERYQTVYSKNKGSAAAPTAGLHFTEAMLGILQERGVGTAYVTLHVGIDTFRPVRSKNILDHKMHGEYAELGIHTASLINQTVGRVCAVGTTSVRTLESAAQGVTNARVSSFHGQTELFIYPGYEFRAVDSLITNFHMPKSTLLMMVSAFAGTDLIREAYSQAVKLKYRFYSFGDAMLIL